MRYSRGSGSDTRLTRRAVEALIGLDDGCIVVGGTGQGVCARNGPAASDDVTKDRHLFGHLAKFVLETLILFIEASLFDELLLEQSSLFDGLVVSAFHIGERRGNHAFGIFQLVIGQLGISQFCLVHIDRLPKLDQLLLQVGQG